jgi:hypothetical protein
MNLLPLQLESLLLNEEQIKELPPSVRRCIQSFKATERTETDRAGNAVIVKSIEIKLINKADALKEISKHIGFYEVDNKQKGNTINLADATPGELNTILKLLTPKKVDDIKTIDI